MEFLNFLQPLGLPIDTAMILLVLLSGLFQQRYWTANANIGGAWKTLILSFIFCIVYAFLFSYAYHFEKTLPIKWFFSYVMATSLYELFLKKFFAKYFPQS